MKKIILLASLLACFEFLSAQNLDATLCNDRLEEAKKSFQSGQLEEVKDKIEDCLNLGKKVFSKEKSIEGYQLLTESFLFRNEIDEATVSFENILRKNPLFVADTSDPNNSYDLIYLSRTYNRKPIISLFLNAGVNYSKLEILQNYNTDNNQLRAEDYNQFTLGYNAALGLEVPVWRDFTLVFETQFAMRSYMLYDTAFISSNLLNPRQANYSYSLLQFTENQYYIDFPLMLRYEQYFKQSSKIIPYLYAGLKPSLLFSADLVNIQRNTNRETQGGGAVVGGETVLPISGLGIQSKDEYGNQSLRNVFNLALVLGAGAKLRIGSDFLVVELRYNRFLFNSVNTENRYSNRDLIYQYQHVDNDFRMDNFSFSIGFEKSFYKPRKKRTFDPSIVNTKLENLLKKEKNNAQRTTDSELKRELNSYIRDLERDKPGILEDVRRGRASSDLIKDATKEFDKIKDGVK